jgi:hypothetical protein
MNDPASMLIRFIQTDGPVRISGCPELLDYLAVILPFWTYDVVSEQQNKDPIFLTISKQRGQYRIEGPYRDETKLRKDPVDVACALVSQLARAGLRAHPGWLCCHTAAVSINNKLVLLPGIRRTGKSTLTACLTALGVRVFTDDYLPIEVSRDGVPMGISSGISPRLRLPVPREFSENMKGYFDRNMAISGWQYGYLKMDETTLGSRGEQEPFGAIVLLERSDTGNTSFEAASTSEVLRRMLIQNFAREQNADRILQVLNFLASKLPLYKLRYSNAEHAASLMVSTFKDGAGLTTEVARMTHVPDVSLSALGTAAKSPVNFDLPVTRAKTASELAVDDQRFVVDAHGYAVHQLNPISGAVWMALDSPITAAQIIDMFCAAFPDETREKLTRDITWVLRVFAARRLLVQAV